MMSFKKLCKLALREEPHGRVTDFNWTDKWLSG